MTTIHARQIQVTKMRKQRMYYVFSNIFFHHIAHTFLPQSFAPHHFTTHIYPSHYTPFSPLPYAALPYTSLHFTSLHFFTILDDYHFASLHFTSPHFLSLQFSMIFRTLYFSLTHLSNRFPCPLFQGLIIGKVNFWKLYIYLPRCCNKLNFKTLYCRITSDSLQHPSILYQYNFAF